VEFEQRTPVAPKAEFPVHVVRRPPMGAHDAVVYSVLVVPQAQRDAVVARVVAALGSKEQMMILQVAA